MDGTGYNPNQMSGIMVDHEAMKRAEVDREPGQVQALLEGLANAQDYLHTRVCTLADKLERLALRPSEPVPGNPEPLASPPPRSGLASVLVERTDAANRTAARIEDLIDRLDV